MSLLEYNIMKARHGRYADTAENRRLHRVGQEYGHAAQEEEPSGKKAGKGEEDGKEKRTYETARKELSAVLSHKDEFIQKYGEDEYNKRVGGLVAEAKQLSDDEHKAAADKDFDKIKQPEKPKDTRSKKEKRAERLEKYKEQLKKVQDKMNEEGASEESRKMGEALEAKWKAKIEKLEAKVNRGPKKKENPSETLANDIKEYTTKANWLPRDGTAIHFSDAVNSKGEKGELRIDLSGDSFEDGYDIKFGENFTAHAKDTQEAYAILEEFKAKDIPDVEIVDKKSEKKEESKEMTPTEKKVLDLLSNSSSKYNDISKVQVRETPKGNWELVYDGKEVATVGGNQLDHDELINSGLLEIEDDEPEKKEDAEVKLDEKALNYDGAYLSVGNIVDFLNDNGIKANHKTKITTRFHDIDLNTGSEKEFPSKFLKVFRDVSDDEKTILNLRGQKYFDKYPKMKELYDELKKTGIVEKVRSDADGKMSSFELKSNDDLKKFAIAYKKVLESK